jgi:hypothetical protein
MVSKRVVDLVFEFEMEMEIVAETLFEMDTELTPEPVMKTIFELANRFTLHRLAFD